MNEIRDDEQKFHLKKTQTTKKVGVSLKEKVKVC